MNLSEADINRLNFLLINIQAENEELNKTVEKFDELRKSAGDLTKALKETEKSVSLVDKDIKALENRVKNISQPLDEFSQKLETKTGEIISKIAPEIIAKYLETSLGEKIKKIERNSSSLSKINEQLYKFNQAWYGTRNIRLRGIFEGILFASVTWAILFVLYLM